MNKLSRREKILLYFLFMLVIIAGGVSLVVFPCVEKLFAINEEYDMLLQKHSQIKTEISLENAYSQSIQKFGTLLESEKKPLMKQKTNEEIDKLLTGKLQSFNIKPKTFNFLEKENKEKLEETEEEKNSALEKTYVHIIASSGVHENFQKLFDYIETDKSINIVSYTITKTDDKNMDNEIISSEYLININLEFVMVK